TRLPPTVPHAPQRNRRRRGRPIGWEWQGRDLPRGRTRGREISSAKGGTNHAIGNVSGFRCVNRRRRGGGGPALRPSVGEGGARSGRDGPPLVGAHRAVTTSSLTCPA